MPKRIKVEDYKAEKRNKRGLEIETADGEVFVVEPPELWPDEVQTAAQKNDIAAVGRALFGDERYAVFIEKGGSGTLLAGIVKDEMGAGPGE